MDQSSARGLLWVLAGLVATWACGSAQAEDAGTAALRRATSPEAARQRGEAARLDAIQRQLDLNVIVPYRSGLGVPTLGVARDGTLDLYAPTFAGPFEPTPFWPGWIWGYPSWQRAQQPVGHRMTPLRGDYSEGYVYEPVYAEETPLVVAAPAAVMIPPRVEAVPASSRQVLAEALQQFAGGDYSACLERLAQLPPDSSEAGLAGLLAAHAHIALGNYAAASDELHRALGPLAPAQRQALADNFGKLSAEPDRLAQQLARLEAHLRQTPSDVAARFVLGYLLGCQGEVERAAAELDRALDGGLRFDSPDRVMPEELSQSDALAIELRDEFARRARARAPQRQRREL